MLKITQGYSFQLPVSESSTMIIKGTGFKFVKESSNNQISITAEESATFPNGTYKYQILTDAGVSDAGEVEVIQNYLLSDQADSVKSKNEQILEAIEAQLAGRATAGQSSMSVGDKSIGYMSVIELLQLRDYFKQKVDKQQGKTNIADGLQIKYKWSLR